MANVNIKRFLNSIGNIKCSVNNLPYSVENLEDIWLETKCIKKVKNGKIYEREVIYIEYYIEDTETFITEELWFNSSKQARKIYWMFITGGKYAVLEYLEKANAHLRWALHQIYED